mmetsp:Transcript_57398/g.168061  ORF Transcript_57398/g.168061 Transcript_57398/m.168061 type:complete len:406 (-) Transcript_57398:47-1264(-)
MPVSGLGVAGGVHVCELLLHRPDRAVLHHFQRDSEAQGSIDGDCDVELYWRLRRCSRCRCRRWGGLWLRSFRGCRWCLPPRSAKAPAHGEELPASAQWLIAGQGRKALARFLYELNFAQLCLTECCHDRPPHIQHCAVTHDLYGDLTCHLSHGMLHGDADEACRRLGRCLRLGGFCLRLRLGCRLVVRLGWGLMVRRRRRLMLRWALRRRCLILLEDVYWLRIVDVEGHATVLAFELQVLLCQLPGQLLHVRHPPPQREARVAKLLHLALDRLHIGHFHALDVALPQKVVVGVNGPSLGLLLVRLPICIPLVDLCFILICSPRPLLLAQPVKLQSRRSFYLYVVWHSATFEFQVKLVGIFLTAIGGQHQQLQLLDKGALPDIELVRPCLAIVLKFNLDVHHRTLS